MLKEMTSELPDKLSIILKHMVLDFSGTLSLDGKPLSMLKKSSNALSMKIDVANLTSDIRAIVAAGFFMVCIVVMYKMFWMFEQCVPANQEAAAKTRARRWKGIVAGIFISAWICAVVIIFAFNMPKGLQAVVLAGPIVISFPVLAWVFLVN